jgi:transposase InsO family protein
MALANRTVQPGLVHHSDRGVQYAAADYVALLQEHQIQISMSRTGNPYDNAKAERFMRTLKYEEIYMNDYETLAEVLASVQHFSKASIIGSDFIRPSATCRQPSLKRRFHHQYFLNYLCHFRAEPHHLLLISSCNKTLSRFEQLILRFPLAGYIMPTVIDKCV